MCAPAFVANGEEFLKKALSHWGYKSGWRRPKRRLSATVSGNIPKWWGPGMVKCVWKKCL